MTLPPQHCYQMAAGRACEGACRERPSVQPVLERPTGPECCPLPWSLQWTRLQRGRRRRRELREDQVEDERGTLIPGKHPMKSGEVGEGQMRGDGLKCEGTPVLCLALENARA